jgi:flagellar hook-associated protein 3 FlgL
MRVTRNMMIADIANNINNLNAKIQKNQQQISQGRRILVPSDDPISTNRVLNVHTAISKNEQYQSNLVNIQGWLDTTESALNNIQNLLTDVNVVANRAASDTYGSNERHGFAEELSQHLEELVQFSKTTYNGKYIFSGQQTLTAPFETDNQVNQEEFIVQLGNNVNLYNVHLKSGTVIVKDMTSDTTYQEGIDYTIDYDNGALKALSTGKMSNGQNYTVSYQTDSISSVTQTSKNISDKVTRKIGEGLNLDINVSGDELFTNDVNVFDMIVKLRNSVERDDTEGIKSSMDDIKKVIEKVTAVNGEVGTKINRISATQDFLENENTIFQSQKSTEEDVDVTAAIMKYESLNMAYQAAIQSSSQIIKMNLLNYIGV